MLRKIYFAIFSKIIPELKILRKNISWQEYEDFIIGCNISEKSTIFPPNKLRNVTVDEYSYINCNSNASNVRIGKFCSIGPNFFCGWGIHPINGLSTSPSFYSLNKPGLSLSKSTKITEYKEINIGNDVFIGSNVIVLDGVTIGDGAVIGAGAVVSKDIPPYAIAVGSPIRIIKYRFEEGQIEKLLKIKWWNFDFDQIIDVEKLFFNIDDFIKKYDNSD